MDSRALEPVELGDSRKKVKKNSTSTEGESTITANGHVSMPSTTPLSLNAATTPPAEDKPSPSTTPPQNTEISIRRDKAYLLKTFPWLSGDEQLLNSMIEIANSPETAWVVQLMEDSPLPKKYELSCRQKHLTIATVFSTICAFALWMFYFEGGKEGKMYQAGGIIVNTVQNLLYGIASYFFLKNPGSCGKLVTGLLLGSAATFANWLSAFKLSSGDYLNACLTAIGYFPMNIYGMSQALPSCDKSPQLRQHAVTQLRTTVKDKMPDLKLEKSTLANAERNKIILGLGIAAGLLVFGLPIALGQAGYIFACFMGAQTFTTAEWALAITIVANLPPILIAIFKTGIEMGNQMVSAIADEIRFMSGKEVRTTTTTSRERRLSLAANAAIVFTSFWATYSAATAIKLAEGMPDDIEAYFKPFLSYGTMAFNGIMCALTIVAAKLYAQVAYETDPRKIMEYQLAAAKTSLETKPSKYLRNTLGLQENSTFKAPVAVTKNGAGYQRLIDEQEQQQTPVFH